MFCKKCGTEMSEDARFCPKCGFDTQGENAEKKVIEDKEVEYQVKPTFKVVYKLLVNFSRAILYAFIICIGFLDALDEESIFNIEGTGSKALLITIIAIIAYTIIKMIFEKIQYNYYEYNFYKTKVEYKDGFLNKEEKELKYKYVREVTMTQNIIERLFKIGTIRIFTNASNGYNGGTDRNNGMGNGIYIHCVTDVKEKYEKIKNIIDKGTADE